MSNSSPLDGAARIVERRQLKPPADFAWVPDLIYFQSEFVRDMALVCWPDGVIDRVMPAKEFRGMQFRLKGRALLPGMVNAHSHAFQRVIRGRTEFRANQHDSFWSWRKAMYSAARRLSPEDIYDASRLAFLEMALSGITAVGEFHYLHHNPDGTPYDDPNLVARLVVSAAHSVGLRIALLRVAYFRAGYQKLPEAGQRRFIEPTVDSYLRHTSLLLNDFSAPAADQMAWVGVAPHSVRAVPVANLREIASFAEKQNLPCHMHVAEQPAEVLGCVEKTGRTPINLLYDEGILGPRFTAVHATHIANGEFGALARSKSFVCACPTTERNLGDGILPADQLMRRGIPIALGSDSHTQIDLLEDASELEYHLRLQRQERVVLTAPAEQQNETPQSRGGCSISGLARDLFACATIHGAQSIGAPNGLLEPGRPADFFTVDLNDPSIAGASRCDLLPLIVFSLQPRAIRDVAVAGQLIVADGRHRSAKQIVKSFGKLQQKLWPE